MMEVVVVKGRAVARDTYTVRVHGCVVCGLRNNWEALFKCRYRRRPRAAAWAYLRPNPVIGGAMAQEGQGGTINHKPHPPRF